MGKLGKEQYSRLQKSEQWKTTLDLLCLNREGRHAEERKIIRFICGKSIMVSTVLLACCKTCNLLCSFLKQVLKLHKGHT